MIDASAPPIRKVSYLYLVTPLSRRGQRRREYVAVTRIKSPSPAADENLSLTPKPWQTSAPMKTASPVLKLACTWLLTDLNPRMANPPSWMPGHLSFGASPAPIRAWPPHIPDTKSRPARHRGDFFTWCPAPAPPVASNRPQLEPRLSGDCRHLSPLAPVPSSAAPYPATIRFPTPPKKKQDGSPPAPTPLLQPIGLCSGLGSALDRLRLRNFPTFQKDAFAPSAPPRCDSAFAGVRQARPPLPPPRLET